mmetsp:Transcript_107878/g.220205  ORF Transcript_107878/g.220205 Transcript_107878/m.220205 type:complete len:470 (-) Transcript_107878:644-2053(-)
MNIDSSENLQIMCDCQLKPGSFVEPILVPDDMSGGSSRTECSTSWSSKAHSGRSILSDEQRSSTASRIEISHRKRKDGSMETLCFVNQSLSTSKSKPQVDSSPEGHLSCNKVDPKTRDFKRHISVLQNMMDVERTNRTETNDYRALQSIDTSFHKQLWRERVAQWCYDVLDYIDESRDVASVAMNIIDRYLVILSQESSAALGIGEFDYEVISFTALFLAIRVSGSNKELEISELLQLSSNTGVPEARHIVSAGNSMLEKLSWDHQILSPNSFLKELVEFLVIQYNAEIGINETKTGGNISNLVDFASYLVEVSVCDIYFSAVAPSKIAFAALALAMICNSDLLPTSYPQQRFLSNFFQIVHEHTFMDIECPQMNAILSRLLHVYNQSQEAVLEDSGMETFEWDSLGGNNHDSLTVLPHVIADESEGNASSDVRFLTNELEGHAFLHDNGHHVNTNTNQTRPVSPLRHT